MRLYFNCRKGKEEKQQQQEVLGSRDLVRNIKRERAGLREFSFQQTMHEYLIAWTPETLIVSKDLEAFVQVDSNPEDKEDGNCMLWYPPSVTTWIEWSTEASTIMIPSPKDLPENKQSLYAICAHLEDIHSIVIQPPSITKWYGSLVINFKNGHSSAPLWFHDDESRSTVLQKNNQGGKHDNTRHGSHIRWGGDEFIDRISRLVPVTR